MPDDSSAGVDRLFSRPVPADAFRFDERVATVFPDMIARSVPGYADVLQGLTALARRVVVSHSHVYDLGCSLGAATLSVLRGVDQPEVRVVAIDNSPAMIDRARDRLSAFRHVAQVEVQCADILDVPITNASLVLLNYTLQFVPVERRSELCQRIYSALCPGGVLVLSEKIATCDPVIRELWTSLHEDFKRAQGYSELEIAQKRTALEGVLVPETMSQHKMRLEQVGFQSIATWFQHYNFASLLAVKQDGLAVEYDG